jgi:hypothetical protein
VSASYGSPSLAGGGYGTNGRARTPVGGLATTSVYSTGAYGTYYYSDNDGVTRVGVKGVEKDRIIQTVTTKTTNEYQKVVRLLNTYGASPYVQVTAADGLEPYSDINLAEASCEAIDSFLPAYLYEQQADQFLTLWVQQNIPVFMGLQQNNEAQDGNANWVWNEMGFQFAGCIDPLDCGVQLPSPIVCNVGLWTTELCAVVNKNNQNFMTSGITAADPFTCDGSFVFENPSSSTVYFNLPANGGIAYAWINNGCDQQLINAPTCSTLTITVVTGNYLLAVATCPSVYTVATTQQFTMPTSCTLAEIQSFPMSDSSRTPFYPYW